ncbi:MAG TPA: OsmC family protein [Acidobacteriaceae bacterium]|nr:OsmC family protein [Terriglobia bacterium]HVC89408.1 OsmC family protein [Acidobacteriaceae bacterium]
MEANVTWKREMAFDALSHSGHIIPLDGDVVQTQGASPMEMVLMALCGCTAIDVISILKKKRQSFTGLTVSAVARRAAEPPMVFTHVKLTYRVSGAVSHKAMEDAVHLSETKYCSVAGMVSKTAKIEYEIEYAG